MPKRPKSPKQIIKGSVSAKNAAGATLIGVQLGPDRDQIREDVQQALGESLENLLLRHGLIQNFEHHDRVAEALFACEAQHGSSLGFAVNNSGLIICPSAIGEVQQLRQLTSGTTFKPQIVARFTMLQALRITSTTRGAIPAYRSQPIFDEQLYGFDEKGHRSIFKATIYHLSALVSVGPTEERLIKGAFGGIADGRVVGGPVFNRSDEVMGICVGRTTKINFIIVQPWSSIENCIRMDWEKWNPTDKVQEQD